MRKCFIWTVLAFLVLCVSCSQKSADSNAETNAEGVVARVHFAGADWISKSTNSFAFNEIMALPAAAPMLDSIGRKLATAPFRYLQGTSPVRTNDFAGKLRSIINDIVNFESYAEMRGPTNRFPETLLAVRLDLARSEYWRTNLAAVLTAWTGIQVTQIQSEGYQGWELKKHHNPNCIRFIKAGEWTLFGWGQDDIVLQKSILLRIKSQGGPAPALNNVWLDALIDWPAITPYHPIGTAFQLPKLKLTVEGRGQFVRPQLEMQFPEALDISLDAWKIPTNAIRQPLVMFSAGRGISHWLNGLPGFKEAGIGPAPNQMCMWAMGKIPFETFLTVPVPDATNYMKVKAPALAAYIKKSLGSRHIETDVVYTNNQIIFNKFPFLSPYIIPFHGENGDFLVGGLFPRSARKELMPDDLTKEITKNPKLVYYDWEKTDERLMQLNPISQIYLMASGRGVQDPNSAVYKWFFAAMPKLKKSATEVTLKNSKELVLVRNAPLGLSAAELTIIAYWLDAPNFPFDAYHDATIKRPHPTSAKTPPKL